MRILETNQKISITVLGISDSLKIIIEKPTKRLVIVIDWNAVIITFVPINFSTDLYSPNRINKGIDTSGIIKNIQRLERILSGHNTPNRKAKESHIANSKMITSDIIINTCFCLLERLANCSFISIFDKNIRH